MFQLPSYRPLPTATATATRTRTLGWLQFQLPSYRPLPTALATRTRTLVAFAYCRWLQGLVTDVADQIQVNSYAPGTCETQRLIQKQLGGSSRRCIF